MKFYRPRRDRATRPANGYLGARGRPDAAVTEKGPLTQRIKGHRYTGVFLYWLKHVWIDILTMTAIGLLTLGLFLAPPVGGRRFPITYPANNGTQTTVVVRPELAYPYRSWAVDSWLAAVLSILIPLLVVLLFQLRIRSLWDFTNGVMGTIYAVIIAECFHIFLKTLIGGFRPYFLEVCDPDPAKIAALGRGYGGMYFADEICRQPDKELLKQAMTSFPSGHSACSFAGLGFLFLYLNAKIKPWANYRPMSWELPAVLAPLLGATLISCSVLVTADHHGHEVVVGILIGALSALAVYRAYFAAIWDWRFNHIALRPKEVVAYDLAREENLGGVMFAKGTWKVHRRRGVVSGVVENGGGVGGGGGVVGGETHEMAHANGNANGRGIWSQGPGVVGGRPVRGDDMV